MKTIWKYNVHINDGQLVPWVKRRFSVLNLPKGTTILSVQEQHGHPVMWCLVDPSQPLEERSFAIYGTSHNMPDEPGTFIGTFQLDQEVFHLFEVVKP